MRSRLARALGYGLGLMLLIVSSQGQALASFVAAVPEIDGASISAGLGLLGAGYLILRSRWGSK